MERLSQFILLCAMVFPLAVLGATDETEPRITHGFVSLQAGRGTLSIVYPCLITLSICAYTAVHPDTRDEPNRFKRLKQKSFMVFWALIFPEAVLVKAFSQWRKARSLRNFSGFGMQGAFFTIMGGFTVRPGMSDLSFPSVLTPDGLELLGRDGIISMNDDLKEKMRAKGRTDSLEKSLVCIQASWMLVQCGIRKLYHLPLTILELHTVMHILCATAMYVFWWKKPLDVTEPISLGIDERLAALLSVSCGLYKRFEVILDLDHRRGEPTMDPSITCPVDVDEMVPREPMHLHEIWGASRGSKMVRFSIDLQEDSDSEFEYFNLPTHAPIGIVNFLPYNRPRDTPLGGQVLHKHHSQLKQLMDQGGPMTLPNITVEIYTGERFRLDTCAIGLKLTGRNESKPLTLKAQDIELLRYASSAARNDNFSKFTKSLNDGTTRIRSLYPNALTLAPQSVSTQNFEIGWLKGAFPYIKLTIKPEYWSLGPLFILYSGGHATVWNSYFPTGIERWIWRAACITVASSPIIFYASCILGMGWAKIRRTKDPQCDEEQRAPPDPDTIELREQQAPPDPDTIELREQQAPPDPDTIELGEQQAPPDSYTNRWESRYSTPFWYLLLVVFLLARFYMTVESFLSLRAMPAAIYETMGWEGFWPHAG